VTDKKKEGLFTLDEIKPQLSERLKTEKYQEELNNLVNQNPRESRYRNSDLRRRGAQPLSSINRHRYRESAATLRVPRVSAANSV
jgi:hypothetical protein